MRTTSINTIVKKNEDILRKTYEKAGLEAMVRVLIDLIFNHIFNNPTSSVSFYKWMSVGLKPRKFMLPASIGIKYFGDYYDKYVKMCNGNPYMIILTHNFKPKEAFKTRIRRLNDLLIDGVFEYCERNNIAPCKDNIDEIFSNLGV